MKINQNAVTHLALIFFFPFKNIKIQVKFNPCPIRKKLFVLAVVPFLKAWIFLNI